MVRAKLSLLLLLFTVAAWAQAPAPAPSKSGHADVVAYIEKAWDTLTRRMDNCEVLRDPKVPDESRLYFPAGMAIPQSTRALGEKCKVKVEALPRKIERIGKTKTDDIPPGLLYLPNAYVVPGGRFNEMYGWDSYFIIVGLLESGRVELARGMVDNFVFEVENYGGVLNANRTYYLTRSQPPFLTSMILAVWEADKKQDRKWLERAYRAAVRDHEFWTTGEHLASDTGLSRYFDFGNGPVPEEMATYAKVAKLAPQYLVQRNGKSELSADYHKGDRSMRESGFDISFRFGAFGGRTHHFAPVCLNSLLFKTERDLQRISAVLGNSKEAEQWYDRSLKRQAMMQTLFWDTERGMFFDHDFTRNERSQYSFLSTFYPLWTGWATKRQAAAVAQSTAKFLREGGLATSTTATGVQWDLPYGWAPLQMIAVEGLRRQGFKKEADEVARRWNETVAASFRRDGTIREKYNVVTRSSETTVSAGYQENVVGFGWTNGVFLKLDGALHPRTPTKH